MSWSSLDRIDRSEATARKCRTFCNTLGEPLSTATATAGSSSHRTTLTTTASGADDVSRRDTTRLSNPNIGAWLPIALCPPHANAPTAVTAPVSIARRQRGGGSGRRRSDMTEDRRSPHEAGAEDGGGAISGLRMESTETVFRPSQQARRTPDGLFVVNSDNQDNDATMSSPPSSPLGDDEDDRTENMSPVEEDEGASFPSSDAAAATAGGAPMRTDCWWWIPPVVPTSPDLLSSATAAVAAQQSQQIQEQQDSSLMAPRERRKTAVTEFISYLADSHAAHQIGILEHFSKHVLPRLLTCDAQAARSTADGPLPTAEELEVLIVVLFVLVRRRGGVTPLQLQQHAQCSQLAFDILLRLVSKPALITRGVAGALTRLLHAVNVGPQTWWQRAELRLPIHAKPTPPDYPPLTLDAALAGTSGLHVPPCASQSAVDHSFGKGQMFQIDPFFFTLDALHSTVCGSLTEADFIDIEGWFALLPQDPKTQQYAVIDALKAHPQIGTRKLLCQKDFVEFAGEHKNGGGTLVELISFLFRDTPVWVIQARVDGAPLMRPDVAPLTYQTPPPSPYAVSQVYQDPVPVAVARFFELGNIHTPVPMVPPPANGAPPPEPGSIAAKQDLEKAMLAALSDLLDKAHELFSYVDIAGRGSASPRQLATAIGGTILGPWDLRQVFHDSFDDSASFAVLSFRLLKAVAQLQTGSAVLQSVAGFDDIVLDSVCRDAADRGKRIFGERQRAKKEWEKKKDEAAAKEAAATMQQSSASLKEKKASKAAIIPVAQLRLSVDARVALRQRLNVFVEESAAIHTYHAAVAKAMSEAKSAGEYLQGIISTRAAYHREMLSKNVPLVHGPLPGPKTARAHGFLFTRELFHIDAIVQEQPSRARAFLETMDLMGIVPYAFVQNPPMALHAMGKTAAELVSLPFFVCRDAAFCPRRPTQFRWETSPHKIQIQTNLKQGCDAKFMLRLEGYNWGNNCAVNTIIVGALPAFIGAEVASTGGNEKFGWPEGWDRSTVTHLANGIEAVEQYVSREGCCCFELSAKSFSNIGFGVGYSMVVPNYGGGWAMNVAVTHSYDRL